MKYYAVIDTNVLVSALLTHQKESATAQILDLITDGKIIPVYSDAIIQEYWEVLKVARYERFTIL